LLNEFKVFTRGCDISVFRKLAELAFRNLTIRRSERTVPIDVIAGYINTLVVRLLTNLGRIHFAAILRIAHRMGRCITNQNYAAQGIRSPLRIRNRPR
jgi:hypothetical protein